MSLSTNLQFVIDDKLRNELNLACVLAGASVSQNFFTHEAEHIDKARQS